MDVNLDRIDRRIVAFMTRWSVPALRVSLAVIFIWFGILKPLRLSPAEALVLKTVRWMPLFAPETWLAIIGWWEVAIGITFLFPSTARLAIALLALQMVGTFCRCSSSPKSPSSPALSPSRRPWRGSMSSRTF